MGPMHVQCTAASDGPWSPRVPEFTYNAIPPLCRCSKHTRLHVAFTLLRQLDTRQAVVLVLMCVMLCLGQNPLRQHLRIVDGALSSPVNLNKTFDSSVKSSVQPLLCNRVYVPVLDNPVSSPSSPISPAQLLRRYIAWQRLQHIRSLGLAHMWLTGRWPTCRPLQFSRAAAQSPGVLLFAREW